MGMHNRIRVIRELFQFSQEDMAEKNEYVT